MLEPITWNIAPEIFQLGWFAPRWYGVCFATGLLLGYLVIKKFFKQAGYSEEVLNSGFVLFAVATVVGARLGHCLFYEPEYYLSNPLKIFFVWEGGLASHGGVTGVFLAMVYYTWKYKIPFIWLADRLALACPLGSAFIRLGNFFNSEILGKPTSGDWGIIFSRIDNIPRHPAQLYEALAYFALFLVLAVFFKLRDGKFKPGRPIGFMFIWIFVARILIEFVKEDQVDFEKGMTFNMGQILSMPFVAIGLFFFFGGFTWLQSRFGIGGATAPATGANQLSYQGPSLEDAEEAKKARKSRRKMQKLAKNKKGS